MRKLLALVLVTLLVSCGKDDPAPAYKFKDQIASGKIEKVLWLFSEGRAVDEGENLSIDLMLAQADAPCDIIGFPEGDYVFFTIPDAVGVYELNFSGPNQQTATILETEEFINIIIADGAIEILTITDTEVTGRVDLRFDNRTYINGNFTVTKCQ